MTHIAILGTRGIPARHGGFETFVECLAPYLAQKGHNVTVYCQNRLVSDSLSDSEWKGVHLSPIRPQFSGAAATFEFDLKSILHAARHRPDIAFVFGYNTAVLCVLLKLKKIPIVMNMDGLEWKRKKWSFPFKAWLWMNEKIGCWLADYIIADHPEIQKRLEQFAARQKITMIPYGADLISKADESLIGPWDGLKAYSYGIFIGRPEPENHVLEMVRAFSRKKRGLRLVVLGDYSREWNRYKQSVVDAASDEVIFPGAIYQPETVEALLFYSRFYCHGHSVGGTNPSLIQAMSAGCRIIAHDNLFNRGVLGGRADFFENEASLEKLFDQFSSVEKNRQQRITYGQLRSVAEINQQYENLISSITNRHTYEV